MKLKPFLFSFCFIIFLTLATNLYACKYTVREVGFVDIGNEPYRAYIYIDDTVSDKMIKDIDKNVHGALSASNVTYQIVNIDKQKEHNSLEYLPESAIEELPIAVLVSPQKKTIPIQIPSSDSNDFEQQLFDIFSGMVESPLRSELLNSLVRSYAMVVIVKGSNETMNRQAKTHAEYAVDKIAQYMHLMPKLVDHPPRIITISPEDFEQERILLWSLEIENYADTQLPKMAVIYGRVRRMGPLLNLPLTDQNLLLNALLVVGADCECGLDPKWMQSTMIPHRWDKHIREKVSQALGFDPENPLVKMEVSQILSMQDNIPNKDLFLQEMSKQLHYENPRDSSEQQQRNTTSITPAQITMLDRRSDESNKEDEQSSVGTASPAKQKKNKAAETPVNSVSEPTVSDGFTMISVITWSSLIIFAFAAVSISGVIIWKKQRKS